VTTAGTTTPSPGSTGLGRALGRLVLALLLPACQPTGGRAETGATEATSHGSEGSASSAGLPSDGPDGDTGECVPGSRGCACTAGGACDDGLLCNMGTCESPNPRCGDGRVEGDEQCDLGDALDDEGACKTNCTLASCGDGWLGPGELCDDGNLIANDACTNECQPAACGDGVLHDGEGCDDGNQDHGDACTNACQPATCGDGVVWRGHEQCDDGNPFNDDDCTTACMVASCGDGFVNGGEQCDDQNAISTDACIDCVAATCGDGHRWAGVEPCDGVELGGATCASLGLFGGTLACTAQCTFDTSGCNG
jgi:cysteine-rich repeat protein